MIIVRDPRIQLVHQLNVIMTANLFIIDKDIPESKRGNR